ncbi:MAG: glycosyltransferase family 4 protein, partial [Dehalococcoidia bacterium]|nr:glycosyltransferase family 4 protein [Dehalococcoidia bacterium]
MKIAAIRNFMCLKGGAQQAFIDMMLALKKRGHDIDIYVLSISDELREELRDDFSIESLNLREWKLKPVSVFHLINEVRVVWRYRRLAKKINNKGYDLAFVDHADYSPLILPFLEIPKVYYCYEPPRSYYEPEPLAPPRYKVYKFINQPSKYLDKYCVKFADLILCNSDYIREYVYKVYGIFAITNYLGVDLDKFRKLNLEKQDLVLSVGVLHPLKAHDFVIRSVGLIPKNKRPRFVIIAAAEWAKEKERLYSLASREEVDLEIKGYVPDEEFVEWQNKAKVVAIAYIMEPSIEPVALGCETPIVAVREGGARETIIHNETGILTNRDEKEFAQAIEYLLDHPDAAAEMGRRGREWIEKNFTWEKCAENLERSFK